MTYLNESYQMITSSELLDKNTMKGIDGVMVWGYKAINIMLNVDNI